MRYLAFALALVGAAATSARAQDAIPDLKGTWSGKGKSIVFGTNPPSSRFASRYRSAARARYRGDLHRGRPRGPACLGRSSSAAANTQEPFAWAIASDN